MNVRFNRRVNVKFTMQLNEEEPEVRGDLMVPEPELAAELVGVLLQDWTVTEITITAENSVENIDDEDEDAEAD